ncbi:MAG: YdcF family protein [Acidobacteria bacterium]|nr:MAG: YdcF family protein [Acidobacteriota bacterium]PYX66514.1 MAG: YdcF family protein [Acidobacteriota bacterium]
MNQSTANGDARRHWILRVAGLVALLLITFIAATAIRIVRESSGEGLKSADVIVVFGAAEYAGRPSPVFRARLDHAYDLFRRGVAPVIITTGGSGSDPDYSEGGVGHDYLMHRGVPEHNLIAETQGSDTAQSAKRVMVIMRANGMHSCVAVSDGYHVFRVKALLEHEGIQVYVAPRPGSLPHTRWQRTLGVLRESISYLFWKLHLAG